MRVTMDMRREREDLETVEKPRKRLEVINKEEGWLLTMLRLIKKKKL